MAVTETTTESWGSRLGGAVKGVVVGLVMFLAGFPLLFWNEGNSVKTAKALDEGEGACVPVESIAKVDPEMEGKLVHMTGRADTKDVLVDEAFGVSVTAIALERETEMFQWKENKKTTEKKKVGGSVEKTTTYTYEQVWSKTAIDSSGFKEAGHENPGFIEFPSESWRAQNVSFGAFRLTERQIARIGSAQAYAFPTDYVCKVERVQRQGGTILVPNKATRDNALNNRDVATQARIGDMRVTFRVVYPHDISIVSKQKGDTFVPYLAKTKKTVDLLQDGVAEMAEMFEAARDANAMFTWIVRFAGFLLMFFGLSMVLKPLSVLADVLPILGDIVGWGIGLVSGVVALVCSLVTIAIAWIFYRPVLGVLLLAVAGAIAFLFWKKKKGAKPAAQPAAPVAAVLLALAATSAFGAVPEVRWGIVTVKDGKTVTADEAKQARATFDAEKKTSPDKVKLAITKGDAATIAAVLAAFPEASSVEIRYSSIDDMSVVAALQNLKSADFYGSTVSDFAPLAACKKLEKLNYYAVKAPQKVFDTLGELVQLKELEGGLSGVESLAFLEKLTKLEYFRVFAEAVDDLSPIGKLASLKHVNIWNMDGRKLSGKVIPEAGDLKYLAACTKMDQLELPGSSYSNLESLSGLTSVTKLDLGGAWKDIDVSFAKGFSKLSYFSARLAHGKVSGLEALAGKPIKKAELGGDFEVDVSFAKDCAKLGTIVLSSASMKTTRKVMNFSALAGHPAITSLNVIGAEGVDFETVKSLPRLQSLSYSKGAFTDAQIAELTAAHPKMHVTAR